MATNDVAHVPAPEDGFREAMKALRAAQELNQTDLARKIRDAGLPFHQSTIAKIESGSRPVRLDEAYAIAKALGSSVREMARGPVRAERESAVRQAQGEVLAAYKVVKEAAAELMRRLVGFDSEMSATRDSGEFDTQELAFNSFAAQYDPISAVQEGIGLFAADVATADVAERYRIDKHSVEHVYRLYQEALAEERRFVNHGPEGTDG